MICVYCSAEPAKLNVEPDGQYHGDTFCDLQCLAAGIADGRSGSDEFRAARGRLGKVTNYEDADK